MNHGLNFKRETTSNDFDNDNIQSHELNRNETISYQNLARARRIALIRNNLILVAILNFLTISGLICCLVYYKWFHMGNIWIGLLYLYDEKLDIFFKTSEYIDQINCKGTKLCEILDNFFLSGIICTTVFILGLLLHFIYFATIIFLTLERVSNPEKYASTIFKPLVYKILSMISYIFCLLFWAFFNKTYEVEGKIGVALYAGIVACSLYLLLLIYYGFLKKQIINGFMIDNLMNPDKFIREESFSEGKGDPTIN